MTGIRTDDAEIAAVCIREFLRPPGQLWRGGGVMSVSPGRRSIATATRQMQMSHAGHLDLMAWMVHMQVELQDYLVSCPLNLAK
jgi:hypothetical protein